MLILLLAQLSFGEVLLENEPVQSQPITLRVVDDLSQPIVSATVRMRTHPGLPSGKDWTLGVTDSEGRIRFTPDVGGTHQVQVGSQKLTFRVAWSRLPIATAVSFFALFFLAGVWSLIRARRRSK